MLSHERALDRNLRFLPVLCVGAGCLPRGLTSVFLLPRWLFEGLGRDKAEELLQLPDTKIGSFMIRESETKKGESLPLLCVQVRGAAVLRADSLCGPSSLLPRRMQITPMSCAACSPHAVVRGQRQSSATRNG